MSLQNFWSSVRAAVSLYVSPRVASDDSRLGRQAVGQCISGANLWLCTAAVDGFVASDIGFLQESERKELQTAVDDFRSVAGDVASGEPATVDQERLGRRHFERILDVLDLRKYRDADAFIIGKKLEQALRLFGQNTFRLTELRTGLDEHGEEAIWIWAEPETDAADSESLGDTTAFRDFIHRELQNLEDGRWPYVRFRLASERPHETGVAL